MKTLFLHVGAHKTGSSTIQMTLQHSSAQLEQLGIYYPTTLDHGLHYPTNTFISTGNANPLAYSMRWYEDHGKYENFNIQDVIQNIENTIFAHQKVILSHEDLIYASIPFLRELKSLLVKLNWKVKPVIFVRNQIDWHVSNFNQHVRQNRYDGSFEALVAKNLNGPQWINHINRFGNVFGAENLIVKLYDKRIFKDDLVKYFLSCITDISVPASALRQSTANSSISTLDAFLLSKIRRTSELRDRVSEILIELPESEKVNLVSFEMREFLKNYYKFGNRDLIEKYLDDKESEMLTASLSEEVITTDTQKMLANRLLEVLMKT